MDPPQPPFSASHLAACGTTYAVPRRRPGRRLRPRAGRNPAAPRKHRRLPPRVDRVEPAGEAFSRAEAPSAPPCRLRTSGSASTPTRGCAERRPVRGRATAARTSPWSPPSCPRCSSDDETAFVLSHEMSHDIAGHIPKQAPAADARRPGPCRPRRRHRRTGAAPPPPKPRSSGHGHRGLRRRPQPTRSPTSSRPTRWRLHRRPRRLRPERGAAIFCAWRWPTPAARRSSPATPPPPSARPPSPASPPRSAASSPLGLRPAPGARRQHHSPAGDLGPLRVAPRPPR